MRVERSFGFVDLCGFTHYTDSHGDDEAVRVVSEFRNCVRSIASEEAVRVAKWLGDGAMFVAVETERLVRTVLRLERMIDERRCPLPLRAGLASGPVILLEGDDYTGGAVNLAARLCDHAGPHEILCVSGMVDHVPVWARAVPMGDVALPGFLNAVEIVRLVVVDHHPSQLTRAVTASGRLAGPGDADVVA